MTDLTEYLPQPASWFLSTLTYSGTGRIEFSTPKGWLEGPMTCEVESTGEVKATLDIQRWENEDNPSDLSSLFSRDWLLAGVPLRQQNTQIRMYSWPQPVNKSFVSLILQTSEGELVSKRIIDYRWDPDPFEGCSLTLHLDTATYITGNQPKTNAKYWVLPCINFRPESVFGVVDAHLYTDLQEHPLRVFPISSQTTRFLASDAPQREKNWVLHQVMAFSYIIPFEYKGELAFIERLPNYDQIIEKLESGQVHVSVTSLMIGAYSSEDTDMDAVDLLPVLGLAIGRPVGATWVEFRDENRQLVYRIHCNLGRYKYGRGRSTVHEMMHEGRLRKLLTETAKLDVISKPQIRGALRNIAHAIPAEDLTTKFYYVFAGLDLLFKYHDVEKRIHPLKSHLTTPNIISDIEAILKNAMIDIRNLKAKYRVIDPKQASIIETVANKTRSLPLDKNSEFGDKIVELVRLLGFSDLDVLSTYYTNINEWSEKVRDYRNDTMHVSYYRNIFDDQSRKDFQYLTPHIMDIFARALLKTIGYTGNYAPLTAYPGTSEEVDWIKPSTKPSALGYK